jgi:hypothetical protein
MYKNTDIFDFGEDEDDPKFHWRGMPEFNQPDNGALRQIIVSFDTQEAVDRFAELLDVSLTSKTKSIWWPPRERNNVVDLFWIDNSQKHE